MNVHPVVVLLIQLSTFTFHVCYTDNSFINPYEIRNGNLSYLFHIFVQNIILVKFLNTKEKPINRKIFRKCYRISCSVHCLWYLYDFSCYHLKQHKLIHGDSSFLFIYIVVKYIPLMKCTMFQGNTSIRINKVTIMVESILP